MIVTNLKLLFCLKFPYHRSVENCSQHPGVYTSSVKINLFQRNIFPINIFCSQAQIHLIGNLVIWYAGSLSVLFFSGLLVLYAIRQRRSHQDLAPHVSHKFYNACYILFLGYWLHYLPYFFMDRTLFLHHYLSAYMFKILLLAFLIDHVYYVLQMQEKLRALTNVFIMGIAVWLSYVIITFYRFSVLSYGTTDLTENDLINLRWKDTWDFILHKRS